MTEEEMAFERKMLIQQSDFLVQSNKLLVELLRQNKLHTERLFETLTEFWDQHDSRVEHAIYQGISNFLDEYELTMKINRKGSDNE